MKAPKIELTKEQALFRVVELLRSPGVNVRNNIRFWVGHQSLIVHGPENKRLQYGADCLFWGRENRQNRRLIKARNKRHAHDQRR